MRTHAPRFLCIHILIACLLLVAATARADVTRMTSGLTSLETVPVGNPGNPRDRVVATDGTNYGRVDYEYRIGKYEVTAAQYTEFLNAVAGVDTHELYDPAMQNYSWGCKIQRAGGGTAVDPYTYSVAADYANRPVNYVSFWDACRFVNWLQNGQPKGAQDLSTTEDGAYFLNGVTYPENATVTRKPGWQWALPTEDEWYKAAYHKNDGPTGNYWLYPTASNTAPDNTVLDPDPGNNANFWTTRFTLGLPYFRTIVGEFENSESSYGTFDQGGNVMELNESIILDWRRGMRGGSYFWNTMNSSYSLRASYRSLCPADGDSDYVGFRVVQVPEPLSLTLLALGTVLALRRRV